MKKLVAAFSIESLVNKAIKTSDAHPHLFRNFPEQSIVKALEDKLKPKSKDDIFTWEQIHDALMS
jgi:hypothetical protein